MINHVVLFKLKEFDTDEAKSATLNELKTKLLALDGLIPELKHIEVGINYQLKASSFDLCLQTHFDSIADLDVYRVHPEHVKVLDLVKEITINRAAVDYEF